VFKRRLMALIALWIIVFAPRQLVRAQGQELLQNPSFDSVYGTPQGLVPQGWTLTSTAPVSSAGHTWPGESRTGASWDISATKTVFTFVGYQFVPGVRAGSKLRYSAWANIFTCDKTTSCIEDGRSFRLSDQSSGARTRIGADPTGGKDPNAPSVVWSGFLSPYDVFQQMTIDFDSQNDNGVTVFVYFTESIGMLLNHVYWDDASLMLLTPGQGLPTEGPPIAPMVKPQGTQPDGSIIHTVQPGDTLSSIAFAYKVTVQQIRELNHIDPESSILQIGQKLLIKPPDTTLAATGSATGAATVASGGTGIGPVVTANPTESSSISIVPTAAQTNVPAPSTTPEPTLVVMDDTPLPTVMPISKETSLCISAFDDANANHWQDTGEKLLPGVTLNLAQGAQVVKSLATTGATPSCFDGIPPGTYQIAAVPPANYGLTTSGQLEIEIRPGAQLALTFGAAIGYKTTPGETLISDAPPQPSGVQQTRTAPFLDSLMANSGLIVFGFAGLVLVGGIGLVLVLRRR
jgi:LysM repeat protein